MQDAPIVDVTTWTVEAPEASGRGENLWLVDPDRDLWLYKSNRVQANLHEQGEDWAEKAVGGLARLAGVPTARIELAQRTVNGRMTHGVISLYVAPRGVDVHAGAVLLTGTAGYQMRRPDGSGRPPKDHVGHTVGNVHALLSRAGPPEGFARSAFTAFDVFAGYLVLDAWVGNQDRHEENWAVMDLPGRGITLAPSFDHGASLGFSLQDERRQRLSGDPHALEDYARRGRGLKFEGRATSLVALARDALGLADTAAKTYWLDRLRAVTSTQEAEVLNQVPRMSDVERRFCSQLLAINRERILDECT